MRFYRPNGILAGFGLSKTDGDSPLIEAGEQWTPKDHRIGWHANEGWELYYQPKGHSTWKIGRTTFQVPSGGCYLIAPQIRHALDFFHEEEAHFYFAVFHPQEALFPPCHSLLKNWPASHAVLPQAQTLETPFRSLIREITLDTPNKETALRLHLSTLCLEIHRLLSQPSRPIHEFTAHPAALRARECMENNPAQPWKLDELAALSGVSIPHLIEIFRREFGQTPRQFLLQTRLKIAQDRLRTTNRPITELAHDLGFSSSQHFATCFLEHFSLSPRQYRLKHATL